MQNNTGAFILVPGVYFFMYLFCLLVINAETAVNLSEDTELFTQKVWMMMGMEVMWRRGLNDKLTQ